MSTVKIPLITLKRINNEKVNKLTTVYNYIKNIEIFHTHDNDINININFNDNSIYVLGNLKNYPFGPPKLYDKDFKEISLCRANSILRKISPHNYTCFCRKSILCRNNWIISYKIIDILENLRVNYLELKRMYIKFLLQKINNINDYQKKLIYSFLYIN